MAPARQDKTSGNTVVPAQTQKTNLMSSSAGQPNQHPGSGVSPRYRSPHAPNNAGAQSKPQTPGVSPRYRNSHAQNNAGAQSNQQTPGVSPRYRNSRAQNNAGTPSNQQAGFGVSPRYRNPHAQNSAGAYSNQQAASGASPRYRTPHVQNNAGTYSNQQAGPGVSPRYRNPHTQSNAGTPLNQTPGRANVYQQYLPSSAYKQKIPNAGMAYPQATPTRVYNPGHSSMPYGQQAKQKGRPDYVKFFGSDAGNPGYQTISPVGEDSGVIASASFEAVTSPQYYGGKQSPAMQRHQSSPLTGGQAVKMDGLPQPGELYGPPMHAPFHMPGPTEMLYPFQYTGQLPPPMGQLPPPTGQLPPPTGQLPPPTGQLPPPTGPGAIPTMPPPPYSSIYGGPGMPDPSPQLPFMPPQDTAYPAIGTAGALSQTSTPAFDLPPSQMSEFARQFIPRMGYMAQNPGAKQILDASYHPGQLTSPTRSGGLNLPPMLTGSRSYPAMTEHAQWQTPPSPNNPGTMQASLMHQPHSYETFVDSRRETPMWPSNIGPMPDASLDQPDRFDRFGLSQDELSSEAATLRPVYPSTAGSQSPIPAAYPHPPVHYGGPASPVSFPQMPITSAQDTSYPITGIGSIAGQTSIASPTDGTPQDPFDHPPSQEMSGPAGDNKRQSKKITTNQHMAPATARTRR